MIPHNHDPTRSYLFLPMKHRLNVDLMDMSICPSCQALQALAGVLNKNHQNPSFRQVAICPIDWGKYVRYHQRIDSRLHDLPQFETAQVEQMVSVIGTRPQSHLTDLQLSAKLRELLVRILGATEDIEEAEIGLQRYLDSIFASQISMEIHRVFGVEMGSDEVLRADFNGLVQNIIQRRGRKVSLSFVHSFEVRPR